MMLGPVEVSAVMSELSIRLKPTFALGELTSELPLSAAIVL